MAAGGWKIFTPGDVLTADDTMDYLQQGVLVFDSSGARGSAIASPVEGQFSYLKDTDSTEYYDGAAWTQVAQGGLVHIVTESFSAVSSVSLDNCFSGDYDNYRVLVGLSGSAAQTIRGRFRTSGADNSANSYYTSTIRAASLWNDAQSTEIPLGTLDTNIGPGSITFDCYGPAQSRKTTGTYQMTGHESGVAVNAGFFGSALFNATTVFDGLSIYPNTGTITGTVSVYGYKK